MSAADLFDKPGPGNSVVAVSRGRRRILASRKAAVSAHGGQSRRRLTGFDLRKGVLLALLLRTVSHDHQLEGNDRQRCITYEEQRNSIMMVDSFVMWSLHCKLSTVFLSCGNLLILLITHVMLRKYPVRGPKFEGRELCNENILR